MRSYHVRNRLTILINKKKVYGTTYDKPTIHMKVKKDNLY